MLQEVLNFPLNGTYGYDSEKALMENPTVIKASPRHLCLDFVFHQKRVSKRGSCLVLETKKIHSTFSCYLEACISSFNMQGAVSLLGGWGGGGGGDVGGKVPKDKET